MKIKKINLFGASGHAKVIVDCIQSQPDFQVGAVFDDDPSLQKLLNIELTSIEKLPKHTKTPFLVAIGNNNIRKKKVQELANAYDFSSLLAHRQSVISFCSTIGNGTVVMPLACINAGAEIGEHAIINTGAVVEHECKIGNFAHISPNASLAGRVHIGEGTQVGIGAQVIQGIKIGKWATIGAGAVVLKDVPDFATVVGNPGRRVK